MDGEWGPATWRHMCLSVDNVNKRILAVNNEKVVINRTMDFNLSNLTKEFNQSATRICIMKNTRQEVNIPKRSLIGKMTDVNIYSNALSEDEMLAWTQCRQRTTGDVLAWETAEWDKEGLFAEEEQVEEICFPKPKFVVLPPTKQHDAVDMCISIGGSMIEIEKEEEELRMLAMRKSLDTKECDAKIWTAHEKKGRYGDPEYSVSSTLNELSGNCAVLSLQESDLETVSCHHPHCAVCVIPPVSKPFYLRGVQGKRLDQLYFWDHSLGQDELSGSSRNRIKYDKEQQGWYIFDNMTGKSVASYNASQRMPIGIHPWLDSTGKELQLSLSTCGPEEFSCNNGLCIPVSSRCDNQLTCSEGEDESQCNLVELSSSYMKDLPPLSNVSLAIDIIQIVETKEQENTITLMFQLVLTWKDSRLKFLNLKPEPIKNIVSEKEVI